MKILPRKSQARKEELEPGMSPQSSSLNEFMIYPTEQKQTLGLPRQIENLGKAYQGLQVDHTQESGRWSILKDILHKAAETRHWVQDQSRNEVSKEGYWQEQDTRCGGPNLGTKM